MKISPQFSTSLSAQRIGLTNYKVFFTKR